MSNGKRWARRLAALAVTVALVLLGVPMSSSVPAKAASVSSLREQKEALEQQINALTEKKNQLSDSLDDQKQRKSYLEEQISLKQQEIDLNNSMIEAVNEEIASQNSAIADKQQAIADRQAAIETEFSQLKARLNQISKTGNLSTFQMLLSTDTYVDYLLKSKVIELLSASDEDLIHSLEEEMAAISEQQKLLESERETLESRRSELEALQADVNAAMDELDALRDEVSATVNQLQSDISYYEQQIASTQEAEAAVEDEIQEILKAAAQSGNASGIAYQTGSMYWPSTQCLIMTSTYSWRWGKLHKGIDIACNGSALGKDIIAAADGTVIYVNNSSTWGTGISSGYGYCVMVDHGTDSAGRRIVTMYAHMSKVYVSVGQTVVGGSTQLGEVGDTGEAYGYHLHFEVREDGTPVDPISNGYVSVP